MKLTDEREALRAQILCLAQDWLDTPYQHQASVKHFGCDCLGFIRGLWRELYGAEPLNVPPYSANWSEDGVNEMLLEAARTVFQPVQRDAAQPGDVLLFRMSPKSPCKHIGLKASGSTLMHAYCGHAVVESFMVPYWQNRHAYSFAFPLKPKASS